MSTIKQNATLQNKILRSSSYFTLLICLNVLLVGCGNKVALAAGSSAPLAGVVPATPTPAPPAPTPTPTPAPSTPTAGGLPSWAPTGFAGAQGSGVLATLPVFKAADYGASGSASSATCSASSNSTSLQCSFTNNNNDFVPGEGVLISHAGPTSLTMAIQNPPLVTKQGSDTGTHTYCYVVDTVDPLGSVSAPSPMSCVANEPDLTNETVSNALSTPGKGIMAGDVGPTPSFLWYASEDGGPFRLFSVTAFFSATTDLGQRPGPRGGWPDNLPFSNPDISANENFFSTVEAITGTTLTLQDAIPAALDGATVVHDDTVAVQNAINAAAQAGGGRIELGKGTFNILRQFAHTGVGQYTSDLYHSYYFTGDSSLHIPDSATGYIALEGQGSDTIINTQPDHRSSIFFLDFGRWDINVPRSPAAIQDADKGATTIVLASAADAGRFNPGMHVQLFTGSYGSSACFDVTGDPATCHFSELNTVLAINGSTLTMAYPLAIHYGQDNFGSSFGILPLDYPQVIALEHLTFNTFNAVLPVGDVDGLLVNDVHVNGSASQGAFAGGSKRNVTIENSSWGLGAGDANWNEAEEFDKCVNFVFQNDQVTGYAAPGAEGPSNQARIYGTEGSSQFLYLNNTFNNVSISFQYTTDDIIESNTVTNGLITMNTAYGTIPGGFAYGPTQDGAFDSFGSQQRAIVDGNTFTDDSSFVPPYIIALGHFDTGAVTNNIISYAGPRNTFAIVSYGGLVSGNAITLTGAAPSIGITLIPDQSPSVPAASFNVYNNTVTAMTLAAGIYIPNPDFTSLAPLCLGSNSIVTQTGNNAVTFQDAADINTGCSISQ